MNSTKLARRVGMGMAALALCALWLPITALAKTKTPFTTTETTAIVDPGTWITDGTCLFITGWTISGTEDASDPRLSGTELIGADAIMDLATGAMKYWGSYHLENAGGAWDGFWFADTSTGTGICTTIGSGGYAGLVARWTSLGTEGHWAGYIVENGPGQVPMKLSGGRNEQFEWIVGAVLDPSTMQPTGEFGVVGKVTLVSGGGVGSHIGAYTDQSELGLVTFPNATTAAWSCFGILRAANGDLLNWVAMGEKDVLTGVNNGTVHFVGGTGRLDAATGSFAVTSGTGTIRY